MPVTHFENLPVEEQQRILDACIDEFSRRPYRQASTNAIVKRAGIPKGTLFYFFGSKRGLFLYIFDQALKRYLDFHFSRAGNLPADLFERLFAISRIRMEFMLAEPRLYRLFFNALIEMPEEIRQEFQGRFTDYAIQSRKLLMEGMDRSHLREGVDIERAVEIIQLVSEGMLSRFSEKIKSMGPEQSLAFVEELETQFKGYFDMIKSGVYR
jgi:AcrR family transcriptional regulator